MSNAPVFGQLSLQADSDFKRQLDGIRWRQGSLLSTDYKNSSILFQNTFSTQFFLLDNQAQNIQDEAILNLDFRQKLNPKVSARILANSYSFSATKVSQEQAYLGIELSDIQGFNSNVLLGFMSDERSGRRDEGFSARTTLVYEPKNQESPFLSSLRPTLLFDWANLDPRRQYSGKIGTPFRFQDENFALDGYVGSGRFRRDSYQAGNFLNRGANNFKESITTDSTEFYINTEFPLFADLRGRLELNGLSQIRRFENQNLEPETDVLLFDSKFSTLRNSIRFSVDVPLNNHFVKPFINYSGTRDLNTLINTGDIPSAILARRSEVIENSNFTQSFLQTGAQYRFQKGKESIQFSTAAAILRYNTPEINVDDRDEQTLTFSARWEHFHSEFFRFGYEMSGERRKSVYLFSQRSSENNDRYSIRLRPFAIWAPNSQFSMRQSFSLRSNYTVFSFQIPNQQNFDQSAREFGSQTYMELRTGARGFHALELQLTQLHIGRLDWKNFSESPLDTLSTLEAHIQTGRQFRNGRALVGFRTFIKKDFNPLALVRTEESEQLDARSFRGPGNLYTYQFGPTVDVIFPLIFRHELIIKGWYQIQRARQQLWAEIPDEYRSAFRTAAINFPARYFPNLEIIARLRF